MRFYQQTARKFLSPSHFRRRQAGGRRPGIKNSSILAPAMEGAEEGRVPLSRCWNKQRIGNCSAGAFVSARQSFTEGRFPEMLNKAQENRICIGPAWT